MRHVTIGAILILTLGAGPCASGPPGEGVFAGQGVVHKGVAPECPDQWRIDSLDGQSLWPLEKPEFQVEGLRVRFTARVRDGVSICMTGTMVEVISIEKD